VNAESIEIECREGKHVLYPLAPYVLGFAQRHLDEIHILHLRSEQPKQGNVGRFLDSLPPEVVIVNVISDTLYGMLQRRGWQRTFSKGVDQWRR
jgi:hypothetical protein